MVLWAINRATALIQELAGGEVLQGILDEYPKKIERKSVKLRYERTEKRIGVNIEKDFQKSILTKLGFDIKDENENKANFIVPTWRHDVSLEEDLIEEIARFYGYDKVPNTLPKIRQSGAIFDNSFKKIHSIRTFLVHKGLTECYSWTFSNPEIMQQLKFPENYLNMVVLQNPLSKNLSTMRTSIIPNLIITAQKNHLEDTISIFEIGPVFIPDSEEILPKEPQKMGILLSGYANPRLWCYSEHKRYDFFDLKGIVEDIMNMLSITYRIERSEFPLFHSGQALKITNQNKELGICGKINPKIAHEFEINENTFIAELNLNDLLNIPVKKKVYKTISEFPSTSRDLAILVDLTLPVAEIFSSLKTIGEGILQKIEIFDVYIGEQVPKDKKSVALGFTFCSLEKTLTDTEIDAIMNEIINRLQKQFNAQIR